MASHPASPTSHAGAAHDAAEERDRDRAMTGTTSRERDEFVAADDEQTGQEGQEGHQDQVGQQQQDGQYEGQEGQYQGYQEGDQYYQQGEGYEGQQQEHGDQFIVDEYEAPAFQDTDAAEQPRKEAETFCQRVRRVFARVVCLLMAFFVHWFGVKRFDVDGDGDFDEEDIIALMKMDWDETFDLLHDKFHVSQFYLKEVVAAKMLEEKTEARREGRAPRTLIQKKPPKRPPAPLTMDTIQGDFFMGQPPENQAVSILQGGTCHYLGQWNGAEQDLEEFGTGAEYVISRRDGFYIEMLQSNTQVLYFMYNGEYVTEWRRRLPDDSSLTLKSIRGKWCPVEEEQESSEVAIVRTDGRCFYDERHVKEEDVAIIQHETGGFGIRRKDGMLVDMSRSSTTCLVWAKPDEKSRLQWRRPTTGEYGDDSSDEEEEEEQEQEQHVAVGSTHEPEPNVKGKVSNALDFAEKPGNIFRSANVANGDSLENQAVQKMYSKVKHPFRPYYVILHSTTVFLFWSVAAFVIRSKDGQWGDIIRSKAGLDSINPGFSDLRLRGPDCSDYRFQVYRWFLYQYTHVGANHVFFNCLLTFFLGFPLEALTNWWKCMLMFNAGVIGGALSYGIWDAQNTVVGMSGGVYALIGVHFAEILLNFRSMRWWKMKIAFLSLLIVVELLSYQVGQVMGEEEKRDTSPVASVSNHMGGLCAGFIIGLLLTYNRVVSRKEIILKWVAFVFGLAMIGFGLGWIWGNDDPHAIYQSGSTHYSYWVKQAYHRLCMGNVWRCVRCPCALDACQDTLKAASAISDGPWYTMEVDQTKCHTAWLHVADLVSRTSGNESIEFASITSDTRCAITR